MGILLTFEPLGALNGYYTKKFRIKHIHINVINSKAISIPMLDGTNIKSIPIEYNAVPTSLNPQNIKANIAINQLEKFFICVCPP